MKFIASIFATLSLLVASAQKSTIGVYVNGNIDEGRKNVIHSSITNDLITDGCYDIVERKAEILYAIDEEASHQGSGSVEESQIKSLRNQFASDFLFAVDVTEVYGELFATARIINMETSKVEASGEASASVNSMTDLKNFAHTLASSTLEKLPANIDKMEKIINRYRLLSIKSAKELEDNVLRYRVGRIAKEDDIEAYLFARKSLGYSDIADPILYNFTITMEHYPYYDVKTVHRITANGYKTSGQHNFAWTQKDGILIDNQRTNVYMLIINL